MSFISGNYADLTNYTIGPVKVIQIAGRDRQRAPVWECECMRCRRVQAFPHVKLMNRLATHSADETLFCQNHACLASHSRIVRQTETLADILRAERREREEAERRANEKHELAANEAAKRAAREAGLAPMRSEWSRYVQTQIFSGVAAKQIMSFDRWLLIGDVARTQIMKLVVEAESKSQS